MAIKKPAHKPVHAEPGRKRSKKIGMGCVTRNFEAREHGEK